MQIPRRYSGRQSVAGPADRYVRSRSGNFIVYLLRRWFVEGMGSMALGLFASLIIGLIIAQLGQIPGFGFLIPYADVIGASSPVVGAAIGVAIAYGLHAKGLVVFSCAAVGAYGYIQGGPAGAFVASIAATEIGELVAGRTPVDILVTPLAAIIPGCLVGGLIGTPLDVFMTWLGTVINHAAILAPVPMGATVAALVGMTLTAPISSAALCIMMGLSGIAAGSACAGCCAQMIGFAVLSFRENGWNGFVAQAIGTSMLQFPNVLRRPQIWIPPTAAGAICGALSASLFSMLNTPAGAGMGTAGLVGPFGAWAAMQAETAPAVLITEIAVIQFLLPAVLTLLIAVPLRRAGWIRPRDLVLPEL